MGHYLYPKTFLKITKKGRTKTSLNNPVFQNVTYKGSKIKLASEFSPTMSFRKLWDNFYIALNRTWVLSYNGIPL